MKTLLSLLLLSASVSFAATAQENWDLHCAKCHASDGAGNTKTGIRLKLKDYTKAADQSTFTDEQALAAIRDGVKNESGKLTMTPYAEKLSTEEIQVLVPLIRSLKK